jgi:hypothetical protein
VVAVCLLQAFFPISIVPPCFLLATTVQPQDSTLDGSSHHNGHGGDQCDDKR